MDRGHVFCVVLTWRASHCRAPMDCSMSFSSPLSCKSATSLPPPTHLSPMNTRGTCERREVGKGSSATRVTSRGLHFQASRAGCLCLEGPSTCRGGLLMGGTCPERLTQGGTSSTSFEDSWRTEQRHPRATYRSSDRPLRKISALPGA